MKEQLPEGIANTLAQIVINDDRAKLLLQGYIAGKEIQGTVKVTGVFYVETADDVVLPDKSKK